MNGSELHRLGKLLIDLSRDATTSAGESDLTPAEVAILEYALQNPGCTITELRDRTGFAQSHVSASVAKLAENALVTVARDDQDGRVSRVTLAPRARQAIRRRASRPADAVIRSAVGSDRAAARVGRLLDELADILL
ncbi:MAG: MarR family transcriptional regulator [Frankiales bacterium]|nr:MarR family transcriptional regulator [Frankiales bacterium]